MPIDEIFTEFFENLLRETNAGVVEMTVEPPVYDMLEHIVRYNNVTRKLEFPKSPRHLSFMTGTGDVTIKRGPDKCHACGCEKHG